MSRVGTGIPSRLVAIVSITGIGWFLLRALLQISMQPSIPGAALHYIFHTPADTGAANVVSAILFDYRGFDTLGEATVIFCAVTGISLFFSRGQIRHSSSGLSIIVKMGMGMIIPFILLYGLYMIFYGHLSPGGGFQGGAVLATTTILLCIVYGTSFEKQHFRPRIKDILESYGGLLFISVGLWGMLMGKDFLTNIAAGFPKGEFGNIFSSGFLPILNIAVGLKVGAGMATIFYSMIKDLDTPEDDK